MSQDKIQQEKRVYNFSPGPATLPLDVLKTAQQDMISWRGTGMSFMEIGHRSPLFRDLAEEILNDLANILQLPDSHTILYLHGGAKTQFSMVPMNLTQNYTKAYYANTGMWSNLAIKEAERYITVQETMSITEQPWRPLAQPVSTQSHDHVAYYHYTPNETLSGIWMTPPQHYGLPLVADATSCLLAMPLNISDFDLIYASAQKNMGPAGITFVIVRKSLIADRQPLESTPGMLRYSNHIAKNSMYNTPSTYSLYITGLVFKWLLSNGGIAAMESMHKQRSKTLYDFIDQSTLYTNHVHPKYRSPLNITFRLPSEELETLFLAEVEQADCYHLKGHRAIGGIRASLYNGMPSEGINRLLEFMQEFAKTHHR